MFTELIVANPSPLSHPLSISLSGVGGLTNTSCNVRLKAQLLSEASFDVTALSSVIPPSLPDPVVGGLRGEFLADITKLVASLLFEEFEGTGGCVEVGSETG